MSLLCETSSYQAKGNDARPFTERQLIFLRYILNELFCSVLFSSALSFTPLLPPFSGNSLRGCLIYLTMMTILSLLIETNGDDARTWKKQILFLFPLFFFFFYYSGTKKQNLKESKNKKNLSAYFYSYYQRPRDKLNPEYRPSCTIWSFILFYFRKRMPCPQLFRPDSVSGSLNR